MMSHSVFRLQSLHGLLRGRALFYSKTPVLKSRGVLQPAVSQQKRAVSLSAVFWNNRSDDEIVVHFVNQNNQKITLVGKENESLFEMIKKNVNIEEFGTCGGLIGCGTCHVILDKDTYENLDEIAENELDLLDLIFEMTSTSRLGCQVHLKQSMDGITVKVPTLLSAARVEVNEKGQS